MENQDKKKTAKKRAIILTVLLLLLIASLTSGTLAVYSGSTSIFGRMSFLFPQKRRYDFDRNDPAAAAKAIYDAADAFGQQGSDPCQADALIDFIGWDFTKPTKAGKGGASDFNVYVHDDGSLWYTQYRIGGQTAYYPSEAPEEIDLKKLPCLEWMAYMLGEDSAVYQYFKTRGGRGTTLDSDGKNFAPGVRGEVATLIGKIGGNPGDAAGWRIWMDSDDVGWNIFWTSTDLSNTKQGDILPYVWKYNSKSGHIQSGYTTVKDKTVEGKVIHQIHGGGIVFGEHPEPTAEPAPAAEPVRTDEPATPPDPAPVP